MFCCLQIFIENFRPLNCGIVEDSEFLKRIGERIKQLRLLQNMKQKDLAFETDMEDSALRRIEKGRINSSVLKLKKIADALHVSVNDLLKF